MSKSVNSFVLYICFVNLTVRKDICYIYEVSWTPWKESILISFSFILICTTSVLERGVQF